MGEQERREAEAGGEAAAAAHSSSMQRVKVYRLSDGGKWDDQGTGHVTIDYIEGSKEPGLSVLDEENNETLLIHNITSEDIYRKQEETIISWRDPEAATELALSFQEAAGCSYTWDNICDIQRNLQFCNLGALEVGPRPVSETLEASRVLHSNATMPHKKTVTRSSAPSSSTGKELIVDEYMEDVEEEGDEEEAEASDNNNNNSDSSDNNDEESIADDEDENEEEAPDQSQFIGLNVASLKSEKYTILRHINQFRFPRSATLNMFHTKFQQDVYQIIYAKKKFANHRFMKWSYIGKNPIYNGLTRLFRAVRLESLVSLKCNFHAKAIRQFYATVFVSPEHDYLVWMTGQQRLEASKDDFISALSLGDSSGVKIHLEEPLDLTQVDEFYDQGNLFVRGRVSGLLPLPSIINRVMRASFFPRSGNNDEIHGRVWNVIKYIKDGTRIDVMDLMIREIATSKGDKNKSIYFAPYIMKLIQSKIDFDNDCDMEHKEYRPRDAPPQVPPPPPPQVPPPPPLQPQGQGSASQGLPGQQAHQEQDPVLTALLRLQSSVDRMDAKYDQMYAGLNVRFDRLDSKVTHMDEMLTEYQQQRVPLAYQRFGRRPSPASQHDDPPSTSDAAPPPSTEAPPS